VRAKALDIYIYIYIYIWEDGRATSAPPTEDGPVRHRSRPPPPADIY
jgi:hypothetical protein